MPEAPDIIKRLVDQYESNRDLYRSSSYNEEQTRAEFLNPFFEALGWDVCNKAGYSPAYMDVVFEGTIRVEGNANAPDYTFRVGQTRKFFVEAKKPAVSIHLDAGPAGQIRRYSWTAKLPLGVLTNFHEFAVYDCRTPPKPADKASHARLMYVPYTEYPSRWDEIAGIFSRDAVWRGSFDKYAAADKGKRGTAAVDQEFLKQIEEWRSVLARNIALRNVGIDVRELNYAVQNTIDRIVFLRMCEDRGIEPQGQLLGRTSGPNVYGRLLDLYHAADAKYNSGLFHFTEEKGRTEAPDTITPGLRIDDKALRDMIAGLYYPKSPYEFSVIGADILGSVYEQFLGKVIRLTPGHTAMVEEKPEVKKAGGVYYTPTYIVDYIVKNTVGKLCEGKTPKEVAKLRIVDPACGSGSFLINAYAFLLNWHLDYYVKHEPEKHKKEVYRLSDTEWRLATQEKKRILLNSIYGVDIDSQAVEVTKLSLLLKVLEGESRDTLDVSLSMFHERALPDLTANIKCGNSLIGSDFDTSGLSDDEVRRINAFDWEDGFPTIMKAGGFDAVIGNPPYVDIKALPDPQVRYIFGHYPSANNRINLFATFIERSLSLANPTALRVAMIVPSALLIQESYTALRRHILQDYRVKSVVRLPNESFGRAAGDVKVDTVIFVVGEEEASVSPIEVTGYSGYERITDIDVATADVCRQVSQEDWSGNDECKWSLNMNVADSDILRKCENAGIRLEDCTDISLGITPYDKYKGHTEQQIEGRTFHSATKKDQTYRKLLAGNDVARYFVRWSGEAWISYGPWLGAPREQRLFTERRILVKQIIDWTTKRIWASITDEELYNTQNAFNILARPGWALEYLLGIINSRLMTYYHRKRCLDEFKMRFQKILIRDCRRFPIVTLDLDDKKDKGQHDKMVELVERMLALHKRLDAATLPNDKTQIQRQIAATDRDIDKLVYELYGLTDEEIQIVEGES